MSKDSHLVFYALAASTLSVAFLTHPAAIGLVWQARLQWMQIFWQAAARADSLCCVNDVTRMIEAVQRGDSKAADELLPVVYEELRRLAASRMANEAAGNTLQPTALVHEAWMKLVGNDNPKFAGRAHFFSAAAEAMRRILIDRARRKCALRHGGGQMRVDIQ